MVNKKRIINKEINYTERSRLIENGIFYLRQLCRIENKRLTNKNIVRNRKWKKRKIDKDITEIMEYVAETCRIKEKYRLLAKRGKIISEKLAEGKN